MIRFECDYAEGAAPQLLERLTRTNLEQTPGYAVDGHCQRARDLIRAACAAPQAEVEFLVGGTQANQTVISAALRPYQGALCAQTGHINVHETGAIEATGHKVLPLPSQDGKITPKQVEQFCAVHWADPTREHIVQPGMVYLSQPTETGLLYTRTELEGFRAVCDRYGMYLYIDGARCGYGLAAPENDVDLTDLARLTDVFYIGGTKVGALRRWSSPAPPFSGISGTVSSATAGCWPRAACWASSSRRCLRTACTCSWAVTVWNRPCASGRPASDGASPSTSTPAPTSSSPS